MISPLKHLKNYSLLLIYFINVHKFFFSYAPIFYNKFSSYTLVNFFFKPLSVIENRVGVVVNIDQKIVYQDDRHVFVKKTIMQAHDYFGFAAENGKMYSCFFLERSEINYQFYRLQRFAHIIGSIGRGGRVYFCFPEEVNFYWFLQMLWLSRPFYLKAKDTRLRRRSRSKGVRSENIVFRISAVKRQ